MIKMDINVEKSRRKTFVLTFTREGTFVVRAPLYATAAEIEAFVARHRRWMAARLAAANAARPTFENGETVTLFGTPYRIEEGRAAIGDGVLRLPVGERERALVALLKRLAAEHMGELTRRLAARYGFSYTGVRITSARTRWGSCGKRGNIAYTFRIAFLTEEGAEYIAVHELCHTRCFDHSERFWREVGGILPDYSARRKRVRACEWAMKIL